MPERQINIIEKPIYKFKKWLFRIGLSIFLLICIALYFTGSQVLSLDQWVEHTHDVISTLQSITTSLARAETSQRSFVLLDAEEYLQSFQEDIAVLKEDLHHLETLVTDNPTQSQNSHLLRRLVSERIQIMDQVIALKKQRSTKEAQQMLRLGEGDRLSLKIRTLALEILATEKELLRERNHKNERTRDGIGLLALFGVVIALGMILMSRFLLYRHNQLLQEREKLISERSSLLDSILQNMSDGLVIINEKGAIVHVNPAAEKIVGPLPKPTNPTELAQHLGFYDIRTEKLLTSEQLPLVKAMQGMEVNDFEILVKNHLHPNGIVISVNARPRLDKNGNRNGAIAVFRDVSERKYIEKEWQQAREAAIEGSRRKSNFLAAMSHEIRTPMNGIIGFSNLLLSSSLNEEQEDFTLTIKKSAEALLSLINGILDHSKIESGKLILQKYNFDLIDLIHQVHEMFRPPAVEKGLQLRLQMNLDQQTFGRLWGDPDRLRQILLNLVGNAIKFTSSGSIDLIVSEVKDPTINSSSQTLLHFEVADTGPGIPPQNLNQLFQPYTQTELGAKKGGTGLGLVISRELVQLMKGQLEAASEPGVGSRFWFQLPFERTPSDIPVATKNGQSLKNLPRLNGKILVVEDQVVNTRVVTKYLEKLGLQYDHAENGRRAVELWQDQMFDLILMDCRMPVMNGYEATEIIRKGEMITGHRVPIVALTAEGASGERALCFRSGMDEVLGKPIDFSRFVDVLTQYFHAVDIGSIDPRALKKLESLQSQDEPLIKALVTEFTRTTPETLHRMFEALESKDLKEFRDCAHGLKSSCATLGAFKMARLCQELEDTVAFTSETLRSFNELRGTYERSQRELWLRTRSPGHNAKKPIFN